MPDTVLFEPWDIRAPAGQTAPVIFASPHSGSNYPADFVAASRLDPLTLRRSEDAFVDELYAAAPRYGAPLIRAHFPRVFVDPNRQPYELDPAMFDGPLPDYVTTVSPRIGAGLGTVARVVTSGEEVYEEKLSFAEAERRIETYYKPYHQALKALIEETRREFGCCLLIDCHSMPSIGGPMDRDPGFSRVDAVLGDSHGTSCAPGITPLVENLLQDQGLRVTRNNPYAGGYTTRHYGNPQNGIHTLQIEINRCLYMDERTMERSDGMEGLTAKLTAFIEAIVHIDISELESR